MYWDDNAVKIIERRFDEEDFSSFLTDLLDFDILEEQSHIGITKLVLQNGYNSLTEQQKKIFLFYVINPNYISECKMCHNRIPWCEMIHAITEGDELCGYCRHMINKED